MSPSEMGRLVKLIEDSLRDIHTEENQATHVAAALLGSYSVVPLAPPGAPPDWETKLIRARTEEPFRHMYGCHCGSCPGEFKPIGHSWSCRCDKCDTQNRSVKP